MCTHVCVCSFMRLFVCVRVLPVCQHNFLIVFAGCSFGGMLYRYGRKIDWKDQCKTCICKGTHWTCKTVSYCPGILPSNCKFLKKKSSSSCCPLFECDNKEDQFSKFQFRINFYSSRP